MIGGCQKIHQAKRLKCVFGTLSMSYIHVPYASEQAVTKAIHVPYMYKVPCRYAKGGNPYLDEIFSHMGT